MLIRKSHIVLSFFAMAFFTVSCIEPFNAETINFENVLVIDARITDENKVHQVILGRSYSFEEKDLTPETNATVSITEDSGNTFSFEESQPGQYSSTIEFAAKPSTAYKLSILTADGKSYESESTVTPQNIPIADVRAQIEMNGLGEEGLQISLTNVDAGFDLKYFRYEYEETYKIIAPHYNPFEFDVIDSLFYAEGDNDGFEIEIKARTEESRVCYATNTSKDIFLSDSEANVNNQSGVADIRFIKSDDFSIAHRYSILVKQYSLTSDAHAYYNNLDDFTSSESVFSEIQPGFLEGNIKAENSEELVLGYFEVAALNESRYFFNYSDLFPGRPLPPYIINCQLTTAPQLLSVLPHIGPGFVVDESDVVSPLLDGIQAGLIAYHEVNEDYEAPVEDGVVVGLGPYFVKATGCIDCREFGSNIKPDFWVE